MEKKRNVTIGNYYNVEINIPKNFIMKVSRYFKFSIRENTVKEKLIRKRNQVARTK